MGKAGAGPDGGCNVTISTQHTGTLQEDSIEATEYKIQKMLSSMEVSKVKNGQGTFFLRSNIDETTHKVLTKLQLPIIKNIIHGDNIPELVA